MKFNENELDINIFNKFDFIKENMDNKNLMFLKSEKLNLKIEKHPGYIAILDKNDLNRPMHIVETCLQNQIYRTEWECGWQIIPKFHGVMEGIDEFGVNYIKITALDSFKKIISYYVYYANGESIRIA